MKLSPIVLEKTNKALSANAGLIFLYQLIEQLDLETKLSNFLPVKKKERGITSFTKFKSGLLSFASGNDCLDDFNDLREEALIKNFALEEFPLVRWAIFYAASVQCHWRT